MLPKCTAPPTTTACSKEQMVCSIIFRKYSRRLQCNLCTLVCKLSRHKALREPLVSVRGPDSKPRDSVHSSVALEGARGVGGGRDLQGWKLRTVLVDIVPGRVTNCNALTTTNYEKKQRLKSNHTITQGHEVLSALTVNVGQMRETDQRRSASATSDLLSRVDSMPYVHTHASNVLAPVDAKHRGCTDM